MFVTLDDTRKNGPVFCHRENATFWNVCFNRPLRFKRNGLVICPIFCQNILWTVINFSLAFAILDNTRKTRPKFFFRWKFCLFFQNFLFSSTSYGPKKADIISTVIAKIACGSIKVVPRCLWHAMTREKRGQNLLSSWKQLAFEMFVPIDLLDPKQMFLSFAQ